MRDATVIGAGPNGLAAAIALAQAGRSVHLIEAQPRVGGGMASASITVPGATHDLCATVFALALASPFLRGLPLADYGVAFVHPDVPFAHPLDDGTAAVTTRSVGETADGLGARDAQAYRQLMQPFVDDFDRLMEGLLAPIGAAALAHPWVMASFGIKGIRSASGLAAHAFRSTGARAMFAGAAAHSLVPLSFVGTAGYGLGLAASAHAVGWPMIRGGAQRFADALASYFQSLGGQIVVNQPVTSLADVPASRVVLCDMSPGALVRMAGDRLPSGYRRALERFRHGPGVFKMDWTLNAPVPWRAEACRRAGTLHLGGTLEEIAASEHDAWHGRVSARPYVLAVQPTLWDASRAPQGQHTLWAYCHVPNGSTVDMTTAIEAQIERFAPGFRDTIVARSAMPPSALEARNANLVGGDIAGGAADFAQIVRRPVFGANPYATPLPGVFLCSSSTPPGVGVHGMCGFHAAQAALAWLERTSSTT